MKKAKCFTCGYDVAVVICSYNCTNCGFSSDWDDTESSSAWDKNDETLLINILGEENEDKS